MALYPPIVASSMPAFNVKDKYVRIYFTLSNYTNVQLSNIKTIHISVRDQTSNNNKINNQSGILVKTFDTSQTEQDKILNRYHIDINSSELIGGFVVDKIYKVQLRFSTLSSTTNIGRQFFTNNVYAFSEWSTVCIIKPISVPQFYINEFRRFMDQSPDSNINLIDTEEGGSQSQDQGDEQEEEQEQYTQTDNLTFTYPFADFSGVYQPNGSSQTLKAWRLRLLDSSYDQDDIINIKNYTKADSGWQFSSAYNYTLDQTALSLKCSLPYQFENDTQYKLLFEIKTRNDYLDGKIYTFKYQQIAADELPGKLYTYVNQEQGYIKIQHDAQGKTIQADNVVLRRSDSKGNFLNWKDLKIYTLAGKQTENLTYYDFTAESGVAYRYMLQSIDIRGRRGAPLKDVHANNESATIAEWQHAYLLQSSGNGDINQVKQLKLKYDFQISSLKTNVSENKTDTIGSKYPYIRKNGNTYYRSFACTGTITTYMDNVDLFISDEQLYDNYVSIYKNSIYDGGSSLGEKPNNYDYIYERKFREKVEQFLYNSNVKIYKSTQEGNILVKLMQVSLTPKNELGRLIYTFSATAYEVDDCSIDTLIKYNFINVGAYSSQISYNQVKIGQLTSYDLSDNPNGKVFEAGKDIITGNTDALNPTSISSKEYFNVSYNGYIVKDFKINYLRLTIQSQPYLIIQDSTGKLIPYQDTVDRNYQEYSKPIEQKLYQIRTKYQNGTTPTVYLGTLFYLNEDGSKSVVISHPNNIYELKDDNLELSTSTKIIPAKNTIMNVDYVISKYIQKDTSNVPKNRKVQVKVGQIIGTYNYSQQLINIIKYKYVQKYRINQDTRVSQYCKGIYSLAIDTEPNTVVYISTKNTNNPSTRRFVVDETGQLNFNFNSNSKVEITSFKVYGMNINSNKLIDKTNEDNIENPKSYELYKINDKYYIYYKNKLYEADKIQNKGLVSYDIKCPVDALVFYTAQVRSDFY